MIPSPVTPPTVVADSGVENVNAVVDAILVLACLHRVLAQVEVTFSNSMIEAFWRSLKHQWLFLNSLDTTARLRSLVAFFVEEHNTKMPHAAFRGQTPDEMYYATAAGPSAPASMHLGRNHQGLPNELIESTPRPANTNGRVVRRERLGGLPGHSSRDARTDPRRNPSDTSFMIPRMPHLHTEKCRRLVDATGRLPQHPASP
jgi:hypothetical protein